MCWLFFILASFMSTVVILNMVIAIMSDTFSSVNDNHLLQTKRMQIAIMIDYLNIIELVSSKKVENLPEYIVLVTKKSSESEQTEWDGSINAIKRSIMNSS